MQMVVQAKELRTYLNLFLLLEDLAQNQLVMMPMVRLRYRPMVVVVILIMNLLEPIT